METTERKTITLHRGGYIPHGCDQQGRLPTGDYIRERQEQAADMARLCGADTSAAELGEGAGVIVWPLAIIAVVAVGSLLVAVFA